MQNMSDKRVKLFSSWFCPFAQRAWIALLERKVDFQLMEIDPYDKTKEFLAINPRGLVPVIVNEGYCVYESPVCIEYVDEVWRNQGNALLPSDPNSRAKVRIWSDFISKKIVPTFYQVIMRQGKEEQQEAKENLLKHLESFSTSISQDGPFFMGSDFSMVDIMLVPFTVRFDMLNHFRNFRIPDSNKFCKLQKWIEAAHKRESVMATLADGDKLIAKYQRYADNSAKSEVADSIRSGKALP